MKRKLKFILTLCCLALAFVTAVACDDGTKAEQKQNAGYKISVTYDANGGSFLNRPGVTLMDMFKPENYQADENGKIHIKLVEPTDKSRWNGNAAPQITLTLPDHFFAGWYKTRTVKTVDGVPVDKDGKALTLLENGSYVYSDTINDEKPKSALPAYTYSDYWDFENDTIDYSVAEGEVFEMTLYAGWVEYYEFNYYIEDGNGGWEKLDDVTKFDYKTTNTEGSATADKDTIWLPVWENGAMKHSHAYANRETYKFPKVAGTTFVSAYDDEACTQQIVDSIEHKGSIDLETCTPIDRVHNIYIKLDQGEQYRIETAQQLANNPNSNGYYEIKADLDFTGVTWPTALSTGKFAGKIFSTEGNVFKIKNVTVNYNDGVSRTGGLFGEIAKGAEIKNVEFENITTDLINTGSKLKDAQYGLFAGFINDEANISGVKVGGKLRIGKISLGSGYSINVLANGNTDGITTTGLALQIYGEDKTVNQANPQYAYSVKNPKDVTVDQDYMIELEFVSSVEMLDQEYFNIIVG